ncbi:MATE family efflux transporter [Prevotella dentasini]|uniref:MATE family efflux transporter n=1 Tax=Prevotella dentasini TaxID=589537 RepID=UPI000A05A99F|nr:MATE family efflux transporter [Prevotella dentasini]
MSSNIFQSSFWQGPGARRTARESGALVALGVSIVVGQIGTIVLGFADTLMIGRHSTDELAAASFVNNMFVLVLIFGLGFSYGLTPIVGTLYGQGRRWRAGDMLRNALLANLALAVVLTGALLLLYLSLGRLGQPDELLPLMRPYFLVNLASLPFVACFNTFKQLSDGTTDTRTGMWILVGGNLLNIIGNYLLIYGKLGLPELGLLGAGVSTMLSRMVMALAFVAVFCLSDRYRPYRRGFMAGRFRREPLVHLCRLGFPLSLQMGMETAAFSLSSVMVGWIGTAALAAHQVMLTISQFFFMVYYGMAAAVAVRVSLFAGQRNYGAVGRSASVGFGLILAIALVVSVPVVIFRSSLGGIFTDSREVSLLVAEVITPLIVYQFGDGLQCAYSNALRGLSHVRPLMFVAFLAYFVVSLPLGYLFGIRLGYGLLGIWYAFPFGLTTAGVLYYWFFRKRLGELTDGQADG